jgi:hypothetical protein
VKKNKEEKDEKNLPGCNNKKNWSSSSTIVSEGRKRGEGIKFINK